MRGNLKITRTKKKYDWLLISLIALAAVNLVVLFVSRFAEVPEKSALRGWDNSFYYFWIRSAVADGDWDFSNDIREADTLAPPGEGTGKDEALALHPTEKGLVPNKYGIGWAVVHSPFYIGAEFTAGLFPLLGIEVRHDGFGIIHQIWVMLGALLVSLTGVALCVRISCRFSSLRTGICSTLAIILASPAVYYLFANLTMAHHLTFTLHAAILMLFLHIRDHPGTGGHWLLLGLLIGLAAITRYQNVVYGIYPVILLSVLIGKKQEGIIYGAGLCLAGMVLPIMLQVIAWNAVYGEWILNTYSQENNSHFRWERPVLWKSLFSPNHGLFYWHPLLILCTAAMLAFFKRDRAIATIMAFVLLSTWYVNSSNAVWNFGASFGHRGFVGLFPLGILSFAWTLEILPKVTRGVILIAFLVGGLWNTQLALVYVFGWLERNGPVTYIDMLSTVFRLYTGPY